MTKVVLKNTKTEVHSPPLLQYSSSYVYGWKGFSGTVERFDTREDQNKMQIFKC